MKSLDKLGKIILASKSPRRKEILEKINLDSVELLSYRLSDNEFLGLKPYIYALSGTMGLRMAALYNLSLIHI